MATTTTNFGFDVPTSSDLVKNGATAISTLGQDIDTFLAGSPTSTAGKNKIINGDFSIWQRGTSFTPQTSYTYNADRWTQVFDVAPTAGTISQQTFTAGTAPVAGYEGQYFHRTAITTVGSSTYYILGQRIENVRTFANQTITVSFWAKLTAGAVSTPRIRISQNFGSGGSGTVTTDNSYNFTPTGSWTRFFLTIPIPSISGKTIGAGNYLMIDAVVPYAAANTVDFWGWQAESGSVATAFQTATGTIQGELAACQRYYARYTVGNTYGFLPPSGYAVNGTTIYSDARFVVPMRVAPTAVEYGGNIRVVSSTDVGTAITNYSLGGAGIYGNGGSITVASGLTTGGQYKMQANNDATAYVGFTAELQEMTMSEVTFVKVIEAGGIEVEHAIIDRGNGEFTSMPKSTYDELKANEAKIK